MNPSYNSRDKHLLELTYLWHAGKELNHTVVETYSGAQVTFPKLDLSLVKNPTSTQLSSSASAEPIFIILKKKNASAEPIIIIQKKNLCRTHLSKHRSRVLFSQITLNPYIALYLCRTHHHQPKEKSHFSLKPPSSSTISRSSTISKSLTRWKQALQLVQA